MCHKFGISAVERWPVRYLIGEIRFEHGVVSFNGIVALQCNFGSSGALRSSEEALRYLEGVMIYRQWKHMFGLKALFSVVLFCAIGTTAGVHILMILMLEGSFCLSSSGILP